MLFWLFFTLTLVLFAPLIFGYCCYRANYEFESKKKKHPIKHWAAKMYSNISEEWIGYVLWIVTWLVVITTIFMLLAVMINNFAVEAQTAELLAERECLVYELENNIYQDNGDDVVGKKALYDQIREFNGKVAYYKQANHNIWTGIFYNDAYALIDPIPLK